MLKNLIKNISSSIESAVFPNHCLICNKIISKDGLFCETDWNRLKFISYPKCRICSHPFEYEMESHQTACPNCIINPPSFDSLQTIFHYDDVIKKVIFDFKYNDNIFLARKLAFLLYGRSKNILQDIDIITVVPIHKKRLFARKYNQSAFLAKHFFLSLKKDLEQKDEEVKVLLIPDLLVKVKNTKPQITLTKLERAKNLKKAFIVNDKYLDLIAGKNILIIDDVTTTGATLEQCSLELKKHKSGNVTALTVAKTV